MNMDMKQSLATAALYFVVANPVTYTVMQNLLGKLVTITDANGRPTQLGTVIHSIVFGLLTYLMIRYMF